MGKNTYDIIASVYVNDTVWIQVVIVLSHILVAYLIMRIEKFSDAPLSRLRQIVAWMIKYVLICFLNVCLFYLLLYFTLGYNALLAGLSLVGTAMLTEIQIFMLIKNIKNAGMAQRIYVFIGLIIVGYSFLIFAFIEVNTLFENDKIFFILLIFLCLFAIAGLFDWVLDFEKKQEKNLLIKREIRFQEEQLRASKQYILETQKFEKGILKDLNEIKWALNANNLKETQRILSNINRFTSKKKSSDYTGNQAIDSLLFGLQRRCDVEKIALYISIHINEKITLPDIDLSIILGNLFDNAVEANQNLSKDKNIAFKLNANDGTLLMELENTYDGKKKVTGRQKQKLGMGRGYGIKNVETTVKKHGGVFLIKKKDDKYTSKIRLSI